MMSTQVFMMDSVSKRLNKFRLVVLMVFTDLQICLAISSTVYLWQTKAGFPVPFRSVFLFPFCPNRGIINRIRNTYRSCVA